MNIIKEDIENLEQVKNKTTVQNVVMASAEEESKIDSDVKKLIDPKELKNTKAFLGASKQPVPKEPEEPKATLDESLFEDTVNELLGESKFENPIRVDIKLSSSKTNNIDRIRSFFNRSVDNWKLAPEILVDNSDGSYQICLPGKVDWLNKIKGHCEESILNINVQETADESLFEDIARPNEHRLLNTIGYYSLDEHEILVDLINWLPDSEVGDFVDYIIRNYDLDYEEDDIDESCNKENSLDEAKSFDLWDRVYEELCPDHINIMKKTRFPDVTLTDRYGQEGMTEIDRDANIVIYGKDKDAFDFAKMVAKEYGCTFEGPFKSAQYKLDLSPDFALYAKIKVPGYQD